MRRPRARLSWVLAWGLVAGCDEGAAPRGPVCESLPLRWEGARSATLPATTISGVLSLAASVNGAAGPSLLVDTGSPVTILSPTGFPGAALPAGVGTARTLSVGALTFLDRPVIGADLFGPGTVGGVLGMDILCHFSVTFGYREGRVSFGALEAPSETEAGVRVPFALEGGGPVVLLHGVTVTFPAARLLVSARVDGVPRTLLVDTGATLVSLRRSLFEALTGDGRGRLSLPVSTVVGLEEAPHARLRALEVGGQRVEGVAAVGLPEALFDPVAEEVGRAVDGVVGVSFLQRFQVTLDHPGRALGLARYVQQDHVRDRFVRAGVFLGWSRSGAGFRYTVVRVAAGSDAEARGLTVGDALTAVDGRALSSLDPEAADATLLGASGETRALTLSAGTVAVRVEELLPLAR